MTSRTPRRRGKDPGWVRSYIRTGGRADGFEVDLAALVTAQPTAGFDPNAHQDAAQVYSLCTRGLSVAEIAGELKWPVLVVKVLVGDLVKQGAVIVTMPTESKDVWLLRRVLVGLHDL